MEPPPLPQQYQRRIAVLVQENRYDGRNFRTLRNTYTSGTLSESRTSTILTPGRRWRSGFRARLTASTFGACGTLTILSCATGRSPARSTSGSMPCKTPTGTRLPSRIFTGQSKSVTTSRPTASARPSVRFSVLGGNAYDWTVLYTGRELDWATGVYYYRRREYLAPLGLFISRDPIGYRGGLNLYEYVGDRPTDKTDPMGLVGFWGSTWEEYWNERSRIPIPLRACGCICNAQLVSLSGLSGLNESSYY